MSTYLILNLIFLAVITTLMPRLSLNRSRSGGAWRVLTPLLILFVLTAIFDNIMIHLHIFTYNPLHISGVKLGLAPIEDFAYPMLTFLLIPALWDRLTRKDH